MAVEQVAAQHAERQVTLARRAASDLARLWAQVDRNNITASWSLLLRDALVILGTAQATAAASAGLYVDDVLAAAGATIESTGRVLPGSFAGIASDGRPLALLLNRPAVTTLGQIGRGAPVTQALASGRFTLDLIARTQVADAGRIAVGTAIAARPQVTGYVRMIVGKTCSRCLILAGRRYAWNTGFARHPRCLATADTSRSPRTRPAISAPTRAPTSTRSTGPGRTTCSARPTRRRSAKVPTWRRSSTPAAACTRPTVACSPARPPEGVPASCPNRSCATPTAIVTKRSGCSGCTDTSNDRGAIPGRPTERSR